MDILKDSHPTPPEPGKPKNFTQVISLVVGGALCVIALAGMLSSSFAGLHMSIPHSLIIFIAGSTLFYVGGFKDNSLKAYYCCLGFGLFFGLLSMAGFVLGSPGEPTMGYLRPDPYLLVIVRGHQELGRTDHILSGVISIILMGGALDWNRRHLQRTGGLRNNHRPSHREHRRIRSTLAHR